MHLCDSNFIHAAMLPRCLSFSSLLFSSDCTYIILHISRFIELQVRIFSNKKVLYLVTKHIFQFWLNFCRKISAKNYFVASNLTFVKKTSSASHFQNRENKKKKKQKLANMCIWHKIKCYKNNNILFYERKNFLQFFFAIILFLKKKSLMSHNQLFCEFVKKILKFKLKYSHFSKI